MNRTTKAKIARVLPEMGFLIASSSFLLSWFSCADTELYYIDLISKRDDFPQIHGTEINRLYLYLFCFVLIIYLLSEITFKKRLFLALLLLLLFLVFSFLLLIFIDMTEAGVRMGHFDIYCDAKLGFWLHFLGLSAATVGCVKLLRSET